MMSTRLEGLAAVCEAGNVSLFPEDSVDAAVDAVVKEAVAHISGKKAEPLDIDANNPSEHNLAHLAAVRQKTTQASTEQRVQAAWQDVIGTVVAVMAAAASQSVAQSLFPGATKAKTSESETALMSGGGGAFLRFGLANTLQPSIQKLVRTVVEGVFGRSSDSLDVAENVYRSVKKASEGVVKSRSRNIQKAVANVDEMFEYGVRALRAGLTTEDATTVLDLYFLLKVRQGVLLGQPQKCQNYYETYIAEEFQTLMDREPEVAKLPLQAMRNQIIASSIRGKGNIDRLQMAFYGASGTGKSSLAEALIRCFQAPNVYVDCEQLAPSDIRGVSSAASTSVVKIPGMADEMDIQGKIIDPLRRQGKKNAFLILDEFSAGELRADFVQERVFRLFFDQDRQVGKHKALEQLDQVVIIIITNDDPGDFSQAMRGRFVWVVKPALPKDSIRDAYQNVLDKTLSQVRRVLMPGDDDDDDDDGDDAPEDRAPVPQRTLDPVVAVQTMAAAVDEVRKYEATMVEANTSAGARDIIKATNWLINYIWVEKLLAGDAAYQVPEDQIRGNLKIFFELTNEEEDDTKTGEDGREQSEVGSEEHSEEKGGAAL
ncbi:hsp7-like protein [Fonsecaea monophora]|uniref:Hsp7-like protein n=1 Tax=Fonsecaea monophora TaxID=254056 RepID=A0A177EQQ5_9EURO|nr:hsp7-like protein [Fonsecaea monophora]KAH0829999.1 hypothetical protein FOPE_10310 [Fonsecaea pedrosoi]OAG34334.1 hsp7-like protein [Fonsecaea monophora]